MQPSTIKMNKPTTTTTTLGFFTSCLLAVGHLITRGTVNTSAFSHHPLLHSLIRPAQSILNIPYSTNFLPDRVVVAQVRHGIRILSWVDDEGDPGNSESVPNELANLRRKRAEILARKKGLATGTENARSASTEKKDDNRDLSPSSDASTSRATPEPAQSVEDASTLAGDEALTPVISKRPEVLKKKIVAKETQEKLRQSKFESAPLQKRSSSTSSSGTKQTSGLFSSSSSSSSNNDYQENYPDENELHIPNRIGFGTMSWGDETRGFSLTNGKVTKKMKRKGILFNASDLQVAYNKLVSGGVRFVDTSESYGYKLRSRNLSSEQILAHSSEEFMSSDNPIIASKADMSPLKHIIANGGLRMGSNAIVRAVERTCNRMDIANVELFQVKYNPIWYIGGGRALSKGLAQAVDRGLCNHVGVCDVSARGMRRMHRKLEERGVQLASHQFGFSLTNRAALFDGRIQACKDLGVIPLVHTPLDNGLATGKYTAMNPTGGDVGKAKFDFQTLDPLGPIHEAQERVTGMVRARLVKEYNDEKERRLKNYRKKPMEGGFSREVTTTQVAINYVVAKGCVPIPGINTLSEAEELLGCLGWELIEEEIKVLDEAAERAKRERPPTPKKLTPFIARKRKMRLTF